MAETKINIGDKKTQKTFNKTLTEEQLTALSGKKLGETIKGDLIGLPTGYELVIQGGSDSAGFPMRRDVNGIARKKILIVGGVGLRKTKYKGNKIRKMVAGNTINSTTAQINCKVTKWGKEPIEPPTSEEDAASEK